MKTFWNMVAMAADGASAGTIAGSVEQASAGSETGAGAGAEAQAQSGTAQGAATGAASTAGAQTGAQEQAGTEQQASKADWPTIRATLAAVDPELARELERTGDEKAFAKRFMDGIKAARNGQVASREPPKDGTPEQVAAWRKANGVPERADEYETPLPANIQLTDEVKAQLDEFRNFAHGKNLPAGLAKDLVAWKFSLDQAEVQKRADGDKAFQQENNDELLQSWGTDYKSNLAAIRNVFGANEEMWHAVMGARGPDGNVLGNNGKFLSFLLDIGIQANPTIRQFAGDGRMTETNVVAELKELGTKIQRGDPAYYKDERAQNRFAELAAFAEARGIDWR